MSEQTNITDKGQRHRYILALLMYIITLSVLVWMILSGAEPMARWILIMPLFIGTLAYFQAKEKT